MICISHTWPSPDTFSHMFHLKQLNYLDVLRHAEIDVKVAKQQYKNSYHSSACDTPVQFLFLNVNGNKLNMVKVTSEESFYS